MYFKRALCELTAAGLISLFPLVYAAAQSPVTPASPATDATAVVAGLHDTLYELGTLTDYSVDERYSLLAPTVRETHDISYIARFVLRSYWGELEPRQREQFAQRFEALSIMNYASRLTTFDREALKIVKAKPTSATRVQVDAMLVAPDEKTIPLSYTLHRTEAGWRIINVIADGVSDLALRRSEYSRVMRDEGFAGLLDYVDRQTVVLN